MAISRKKPRKPRGKKVFEDRLSTLPDDLLHQILSFLDFVDVVSTSLISSRWRNVWKFVPWLNFSSDRFYEHTGDDMPQCMFWHFISQALFKVECPIRRISISSDDTCIMQLNKLLWAAPFKNVKELCFLNGDYVGHYMVFPQEICETVTALTIDFHNNIPVEAEAPFSKLKSLYLRGVSISGDMARNLLSGESVCLENVHIEGCKFEDVETINVYAKNIQKLTILNMYCFGDTWIVGPFDFGLHIATPNLVSFSYIGPMLTNIVFSNTTSLKDVLFRIIRVPISRIYGFGIKSKNLSPHPTRFLGFDHAKVLTISSLVVKYMSPKLNFYTGSFILDHLNCLKLGLRYNIDCIEGLINLLKHAPNLEALVIRFREISMDSWVQKNTKGGPVVWKSRMEDIACLSYHLTNIDISGFDGSKIAIEVVKFLLRNAKVLEKAEISMSRSKHQRQKLFNKLADKFCRASPRAVITFSTYAQRGFPGFQGGDSDPEDN